MSDPSPIERPKVTPKLWLIRKLGLREPMAKAATGLWSLEDTYNWDNVNYPGAYHAEEDIVTFAKDGEPLELEMTRPKELPRREIKELGL